MVREGELIPVTISDWPNPAYVHKDDLATVELAAAGELRSRVTTLLSPFDPLVWDRKRAEMLFDFSYRIETYTPAAKRRYGYYSLPILRRGALVGRLDPKAHRKEGILEVRSLHLEPGVRPSDRLALDIRSALTSFALWQGLKEIRVVGSNAWIFPTGRLASAPTEAQPPGAGRRLRRAHSPAPARGGARPLLESGSQRQRPFNDQEEGRRRKQRKYERGHQE